LARSYPHTLSWPDRLPARCQPFPYAPLFRSGMQFDRPGLCRGDQPLDAVDLDVGLLVPAHLGERDQVGGARHGVALEELLGLDPDRKSTRLNSSHVKTSYAVFCLKKKRELRT